MAVKIKYDVLTNELASRVSNELIPWYDVGEMVIKDNGIVRAENYGQIGVVIPSCTKIKQWIANNVVYKSEISRKIIEGNTSGGFIYHGGKVSAKTLSSITGYSVNTIYTYWQRFGKDQKKFEEFIDAHVSNQYQDDVTKLIKHQQDDDDLEIEFV